MDRVMRASFTPDEVAENQRWLLQLARHLVGGTRAEDLAQETWAAAARRPLARDRSIRPWLTTVIRNFVRLEFRSERRRRTRERDTMLCADDRPSTPEQLLIQREVADVVRETLARLGEPHRSTILLCYAEELS